MVRTIRVGADVLGRPDAGDVLDMAIALIEEYGWHKIDSNAPVESSTQNGYTLHDAIGEACTRLSEAVSPGRSGSKDWTIHDEQGTEENLRRTATKLVSYELPQDLQDQGLDWGDKSFNDRAQTEDEVLAVLRAARDKVTKEVQV